VVFDTTILGSNPSAPAKKMNKLSIKLNFFEKIKNKLFPFFRTKELNEVFNILEKEQPKNIKVAMFVGGCVRKYLNKEKVDDIDIATIFSPEEIKEKFKNTKIKVIETGIEYGSVVLLVNDKKFEITTLRKDIKTDGRHAEISFTDDWTDDSNRRDITINAIYMDRKGKIFDPQLGIKDLKNNIVKFIGDPNKRIEEDYLRILRFLRFSIQYKGEIEIENENLKAIKFNLNGIKNISKERILNELLKIVSLNNFLTIFENKEINNIFSLIFPELIHLKRFEKKQNLLKFFELNQEIILAILLIDSSTNYEYFCHKYKTSNILKNNLDFYAKKIQESTKNINFFKKDLERNIYFFGKEKLKKLNKLTLFIDDKKNFNDYKKIFKNIESANLPKFPYDGRYLIKKGFVPGKKMGLAIKALEEEWLNNGYTLKDEILNNIIKKFQN
jgi:tRNA nucleotidyltransferase/poly(A) polymerase